MYVSMDMQSIFVSSRGQDKVNVQFSHAQVSYYIIIIIKSMSA